MENQTELKWYQKPTGVIILLIFLFPVGLYLMWKNELWTKKTRWIVTGVLALIVIAGPGGDLSAPTECDCSKEFDRLMQATIYSGSPQESALSRKCDRLYPNVSYIYAECD